MAIRRSAGGRDASVLAVAVVRRRVRAPLPPAGAPRGLECYIEAEDDPEDCPGGWCAACGAIGRGCAAVLRGCRRWLTAGAAVRMGRHIPGASCSQAPLRAHRATRLTCRDHVQWGPGELRPAPFAPAVTVPSELKINPPSFLMEGQFREPNTEGDLEGLRAAGAVAAAVLDEACKAVAPGVTTEEIDAVAHAACRTLAPCALPQPSRTNALSRKVASCCWARLVTAADHHHSQTHRGHEACTLALSSRSLPPPCG